MSKTETVELGDLCDSTKAITNFDDEDYYKLLYSIEESPPWYMAIALGSQVCILFDFIYYVTAKKLYPLLISFKMIKKFYSLI